MQGATSEGAGHETDLPTVVTRDELYRLIGTLLDRLQADCEMLGFDGALALERLWAELDVIGRRIGLVDERFVVNAERDRVTASHERGKPPLELLRRHVREE